MLSSHCYKAQVVMGLILLGSVSLLAQKTATRNTTTTPAKPAAKPGGSGVAGTSNQRGLTKYSTVSRPGPIANGGSNRGLSVNRPTGNGVTPTTHPAENGDARTTRPFANGSTPPPKSATTGVTGRPLAKGNQQVQLKGGDALQRRQNGQISDVHVAGRGMDIHHSLGGGRQVVVERADHSRIFAERGRPGYIQRPYSFHGHEFAARSYSYHGQVYQQFYRNYSYRGATLQVYAPAHYYSVGFYGWAYNPWAAPVTISWGFGAAPWYGYYGGYFAPSPVYPNASLWLTDYMISNDLADAYAAGQETGTLAQAQPQDNAPPQVTPEVKQMIANEVRNQINLENAEAQTAPNADIDPASSGIARMLGDGHRHVFVVSGSLDVIDGSGSECGLSGGDALGLSSPPPPDATAISLVVLSSKGSRECAKSVNVTVALNDLQEMQNHMRTTIDRGLGELQAKQGKGGLPTAPPSAQAEPTKAAFADLAPPAAPTDANDINQQLIAADQAEKDVTSQAGASGN